MIAGGLMRNTFGEVILRCHFHAQLAASFVTSTVTSAVTMEVHRVQSVALTRPPSGLHLRTSSGVVCRSADEKASGCRKNLCHVCEVDMSGLTETSVRMGGWGTDVLKENGLRQNDLKENRCDCWLAKLARTLLKSLICLYWWQNFLHNCHNSPVFFAEFSL